MESYIHGGLQLIKEKLEDNDNFFITSAESPILPLQEKCTTV